MTTPAPPTIPKTELASPTFKPQEISFPLPKALHTTGHIHLSFLKHCATVYLVTSTPGDSAGSVKPVGSFVYAMPDVSSLFVIFLLPSCCLCLSLPHSICLTTTRGIEPCPDSLVEPVVCLLSTPFEDVDICHIIPRQFTPRYSDHVWNNLTSVIYSIPIRYSVSCLPPFPCLFDVFSRHIQSSHSLC